MKRFLSTLITVLGLGGPTLPAGCSPGTVPAPFYLKSTTRDLKDAIFSFPPAFERERGVSWDGRIGWKTEERAWVFAAALEDSLKGIIRGDSPYRLSVAVIRMERRTGTVVVEFTIKGPSGENVELVEVEGTGPRDLSMDEVYPAVAGQIVTTFEKNVLK